MGNYISAASPQPGSGFGHGIAVSTAGARAADPASGSRVGLVGFFRWLMTSERWWWGGYVGVFGVVFFLLTMT